MMHGSTNTPTRPLPVVTDPIAMRAKRAELERGLRSAITAAVVRCRLEADRTSELLSVLTAKRVVAEALLRADRRTRSA